MPACSLMLAATLLIASPAAAGTQDPDCRACEDRGLIACRRCEKEGCTGAEVELCSAALECRTCRGARLENCRKCKAGAAVDLEARRAELAAWLEEARAVDAFMGKELHHARSRRFVLTYDIKKIDVKGGGNEHGGMHVYLARLEEFARRFREDLPCEPEDFLARTRVMLWGRRADQEKASLKYTLQPSSTESKLMGAAPVVSIFYDKGHLHEEFELHQAMVHQVAHCLLSNVFDGIWPGNIKGGWIDEGLAHYYENALFGEVRHYCYVEGDSIRYFKFGRWEPEVRQAVERDEALAFLGVAGRNTVEMTPEERMFAWSHVDHVLRAHPGRFAALARAIKQKKPVAEAVGEALGLTPFQLDAAWREWVRATYSLRPQK